MMETTTAFYSHGFSAERAGSLAQSAGLEQTCVSRLETGTPPRAAADISALAHALGVSDAVLTAKALTVRRTGTVRMARG